MNKGARRLTKRDKAFIELMCHDYGVEIKNSGCGSCWLDAAVEVAALMSRNSLDDVGHVKLRDGVDVYINGHRVNAATCNDERECRRLLALGAPEKLFTFTP